MAEGWQTIPRNKWIYDSHQGLCQNTINNNRHILKDSDTTNDIYRKC